ncbi:MAG: 1-acyl-sn-glycerol-3-phosphate acyltransferase [Rhodobacteraceae bacterium]|nr:1-acyl-sn-glycerol-3-phosphate acyltransferase [Paracoccaceae bacterium]
MRQSTGVFGTMVQWVRSLLFIMQMYVVMAVMALAITPLALFRIDFAYLAVRKFCLWVRFSARIIIGLDSEVRGTVPAGEVLICAKHQSFFDILILCSVIERPRFVMKRQILMLPIVGYYARRIGCIPIDRGKGSIAIQQMLDGLAEGPPDVGPLIIYPQGTRVAPGAKRRYRIGSAVLYDQFASDCVPVAVNVGLFWPKAAVMRRKGVAVVEFLPPIEAGLPQEKFMARLEEVIESHSDRLMREAGCMEV